MELRLASKALNTSGKKGASLSNGERIWFSIGNSVSKWSIEFNGDWRKEKSHFQIYQDSDHLSPTHIFLRKLLEDALQQIKSSFLDSIKGKMWCLPMRGDERKFQDSSDNRRPEEQLIWLGRRRWGIPRGRCLEKQGLERFYTSRELGTM